MNAPFTLRQLTGKPAAPAPLSQSVLVIVDAQNVYRNGPLQLDGVEPALDECARLLARARALKVPVIHIQHDAGPGSPFDIHAESGAIADKVTPAAGEAVKITLSTSEMAGDNVFVKWQDAAGAEWVDGSICIQPGGYTVSDLAGAGGTTI